jgi:hypothetical protein
VDERAGFTGCLGRDAEIGEDPGLIVRRHQGNHSPRTRSEDLIEGAEIHQAVAVDRQKYKILWAPGSDRAGRLKDSRMLNGTCHQGVSSRERGPKGEIVRLCRPGGKDDLAGRAAKKIG